MRQHSGAPAPKRNRRITRRIFPPDSEKSSGNETSHEQGAIFNNNQNWCQHTLLCMSGHTFGPKCKSVRKISPSPLLWAKSGSPRGILPGCYG